MLELGDVLVSGKLIRKASLVFHNKAPAVRLARIRVLEIQLLVRGRAAVQVGAPLRVPAVHARLEAKLSCGKFGYTFLELFCLKSRDAHALARVFRFARRC